MLEYHDPRRNPPSTPITLRCEVPAYEVLHNALGGVRDVDQRKDYVVHRLGLAGFNLKAPIFHSVSQYKRYFVYEQHLPGSERLSWKWVTFLMEQWENEAKNDTRYAKT